MKKVYTRYSLQSHLLIISKHVNVPTVFKRSVSRETIKKFSKSSAWRMRRYLRNCSADYRVMVTLTYPCGYPKDGAVFKEHLRRFIQECKRFTQRNVTGGVNNIVDSWSMFWFMEFQSRGAAHFHIFSTHHYPKDWIASTWYRIVGSEDIRHKQAGTRIEQIRSGRRGTTAYAGKYAAKSEQKNIPGWVKNAGRFWGVSGLRLAVVADILVSSVLDEDSKVKKATERVHSLLRTGLERGEIAYNKIGTSRIMFIRSDGLVKDLMLAMHMLEIASAMAISGYYLEQLHHERESWYADSMRQ